MLTIYPSQQDADPITVGSSSFFRDLGQMLGTEVVAYSSARAVLLSAIKALGFSRDDEILVPPFLSHCILSAIGRSGFPARELSSRTKGILVYHQFGFPQNLDEIDALAKSRGLIIINDCANSIFSKFKQRYLTSWGDVVALSLSKFYACELGGGMVSHHARVNQWLKENHDELSTRHARKSDEALETLVRVRQDLTDFDNQCTLDGLYGQLPGIVSFPSAALRMLPVNMAELDTDRSRRTELWGLVKERFPDLVPKALDCDIVPFAIPLAVSGVKDAQKLVRDVASRLGVEVPILHFDFNCNMLRPDYQQAVVLGCHAGWNADLVVQICDLVETA